MGYVESFAHPGDNITGFMSYDPPLYTKQFSPQMIASGGLMSYAIDFPDLFGRSAVYVDRILKREKPADLPVQAPTKFKLTLNLRTAKALGIEFSPKLLALADEVVE
jgi:putative ABC transport system substrate-binding protein